MKAQTNEDFDRQHLRARSTNREFGLVLGSFLLLVAVFPLLHHNGVRRWAILGSAAFYSLAWLFPAALAPLNHVWSRLGALLNLLSIHCFSKTCADPGLKENYQSQFEPD
jgi:hypothetical protein